MNDSEEKICSNCQSPISGNYCSNCGQKYHAHKETFGELVYEFFSDFTHFDSKFFRCLIPLLFRPGALTLQYIAGKRASQFHPIRLYIFSSFIYFFLVFSFSKVNDKVTINKPITESPNRDSLKNKIKNANQQYQLGMTDSVIDKETKKDTAFQINFSGVVDSLISKRISSEAYLKMQDNLPKEKRDNYFKKLYIKHALKLNEEGRKDQVGLLHELSLHVVHNIPKMLFFLLPLFALTLKLLYIRRRSFYYFDHAVLSLHFFSFTFILLTFTQFVFDPLFKTSWFDVLSILWISTYLFLAMRRIYKQSMWKTILKYFLLGSAFLVLLIVAFAINLIISATLV